MKGGPAIAILIIDTDTAVNQKLFHYVGVALYRWPETRDKENQ